MRNTPHQGLVQAGDPGGERREIRPGHRPTVGEMPDAAFAVYQQIEHRFSQMWQVRRRNHDIAGGDHFTAS